MESKQYVLNHDFGYGREPEVKNLNKLKLRNFEDVKAYILWTLKEAFFSAIIDENKIEIFDENSKIQIIIEEYN